MHASDVTHRAQYTPSPCKDLFADRYLNLLWGRLACELLVGSMDDAQSDIKQIESYIATWEVGSSFPPHPQSAVPALQAAQERCWLMHYGLFILSQHEDGCDLFLRTFNRKEWARVG